MKRKIQRTRAGKKRVGGEHWFVFERGNGLTGWHVERVFKRYGVPVLKRDYAARSPTVGVSVPAAQAVWAEYLLSRAGMTNALTTPLLNPQHANTKAGPMPPDWGRPSRQVGIMGFLVWVLGMAFAGDTAKDMKTKSTKGKGR
jgi:hypothetical protein